MNPLSETAAWAAWQGEHELGPYTVGAEEEIMLLDPQGWSLAHRIESVLPRLPLELTEQMTAETHGSALELQTAVHADVPDTGKELRALRSKLELTLEPLGLGAAAAGTHPFAVWQEIVVSGGDRYQFVYGSMRELARREPTFALHVHIGIPDGETAIRVNNRMRVHLPLLLALSANSPYWQGRDTGLASARTPLFQAFPRVGIPRSFDDYAGYVEAVDLLIRSGAVPEPTFLWWDVRPQPRFGTVEIRIMDSQTTADDTVALIALVQCLARLEAEEEHVPSVAVQAQEVIAENRFIAARDGVDAELIDAELERRVSIADLLEDLLALCRPHAQDLGCEAELDAVPELARNPGAKRQLELGSGAPSLAALVQMLNKNFCPADERARRAEA